MRGKGRDIRERVQEMHSMRVVAMQRLDDEIKEVKRRIAWAETGSETEYRLREKLRELEAQKKFETEPKQDTSQLNLF